MTQPTERPSSLRQDNKRGQAILFSLLVCLLACLGRSFPAQAKSPGKALPLLSSSNPGIFKLSMLDEMNGWAWGSNKSLLHTIDGGGTWQDVTPTSLNYSTDRSVFIDSLHAWVALQTDGFAQTSDAGKTWHLLKDPNLDFLRFVNLQDGWGAVQDAAAGTGYIQIYETHDSGISFSPANVTDVEPQAIANTFSISDVCGGGYYFDFGKLIKTAGTESCGNGGPPYVYVTHDRGKNWKTIRLPAPANLKGARSNPAGPVFVTEKDGFLPVVFFADNLENAGYLVVYATHNGGDTWDLTGGRVNPVGLFGPMYQFVSTRVAFLINQSTLFTSQDGTQSWQAVTSNFDFSTNDTRQITSLQFVSATTGWLILKDDGKYSLYKTTDGGVNWSGPAPSGGSNATFEGQIAFVGVDGNIYLLSGSTGKLQQLTNDAANQTHYSHPTFSPTGKYLAFRRLAKPIDLLGSLSIVDLSSLAITQVADQTGFGYEWFSDGSRISYLQDGSLYTFDPVNSKRQKVMDGIFSFAWSPTGNKLHYSLLKDARDEICGPEGSYILDTNTGVVVKVDFDNKVGDFSTQGSWSPDGKWVMVNAGCIDEGGYFPVDTATGRTSEAYLNRTQYLDFPPAWAPDSQTFAEILDVMHSGRQAIVIETPQGVVLHEIPLISYKTLYSPTGGLIVSSDEINGISVISTDTWQVRKIIEKKYKKPLAWSPDGSQILISDVVYDTQLDLPAYLSVFDVNKNAYIINGVQASGRNYGADAAWGKAYTVPARPLYSLSGEVHLGDFSPLAGVSILLDGSQAAVTDAGGKFRIDGVSAGEHAIEPNLNGYIFSPKVGNRAIQDNNTSLGFLAQKPADITLKAIEVSQVVQDLNNSVPLVAGKQTIVQLYFQSSNKTISGFRATLTGKQSDGSSLPGSPLAAENGDIEVTPASMDALRQDINTTEYFRLPPEWLTGGEVILQAGWGTDAFVCDIPDCQVKVTFQPVPKPEMRFFLVYTEGRSPNSNVIPGVKNEIITEYPISGIKSDPGDEWELYMQPLFYDTDSVYSRLLLQRGLDNCTIGCQRIYVGILDDKPQTPMLGSSNLAFQGAAAGFWIPDRRSTLPILPHEVAHALGRPHTPFCGASNSPLIVENDYPHYPNGSISPSLSGDNAVFGLRISDPSHPIELFNPSNSFDLMTYCFQDADTTGGLWPSDYTYEKILDQIRQRYAGTSSGKMDSLSHVFAQAPISMVISGLVDLKGNTIPEISTYVAPVTSYPVENDGAYKIKVADRAGNMLLKTFFNPDSITPDQGLINQVIPWPDGAARLTISLEDHVLYDKSASANSPQVKVLSPNGEDSWNGDKATITWSASDADNDTLHYAVQYSQDNGQTWSTLAADLTGQELEIPLSLIPGSSKSLIRVLASDGFSTASDSSDSIFKVAGHAPDLKIDFPEDGHSYRLDQLVILQGESYDIEDGQITNLTWMYDSNKSIASGDFISIPASQMGPGRHTITLAATDSDGNASTVSLHVIVVSSGATISQPATGPGFLFQSLPDWALPVLTGVGGLGLTGLGATLLLYYRSKRKNPQAKQNKAPVVPRTSRSQGIRLAAPPDTQPAHPEQKRAPAGADLQTVQSLSQAGKYPEAFELLRRIVQVEPGNAQAWLVLGYTLVRLRDTAGAERCFLRAKKLNHPNANQALAWLKDNK
jgi:photosystem II stability/assembly factor-like uncharacterized protein